MCIRDSPLTTPNFGAWIGVFKPNSRNRKCVYYQNYCIDSSQILHSDKDHQMPFVGGPTNVLQIQDGGRPPSWKNQKIATFQPQFERFWRNLACRCSSTSRPFRPLKIWNFKNPRWRRPPSWKIAISQPQFNWFWRNLAWWCISNLLTVPTVKN